MGKGGGGRVREGEGEGEIFLLFPKVELTLELILNKRSKQGLL